MFGGGHGSLLEQIGSCREAVATHEPYRHQCECRVSEKWVQHKRVPTKELYDSNPLLSYLWMLSCESVILPSSCLLSCPAAQVNHLLSFLPCLMDELFTASPCPCKSIISVHRFFFSISVSFHFYLA